MKSICLLFMLAMAVQTLAQDENNKKYLGTYTQPAPNVGSLGKFVDYPVSFYTGTPNISIPIYELQDGAAKTSISLSYHASGIRVAELASWVGLGWALNAGGMITRSVKGGPDDGVFQPGWTGMSGYYIDSGIRRMPKFPYPVNGEIPSGQQNWETRRIFWYQFSSGNADGESDLYTFNANGISGKFIFDENKTARLLTDENMKIDVFWDGHFKSWTITSQDGIKYFFGENSIWEVDSIFSNSGIDNNTLKPTSWLLTKIVYPNTKDTIYYDYVPEVYAYYDLGQENNVFSGMDVTTDVRNACQFIGLPGNVYRTGIKGYRLRNIRTRNYKVVFGVNTATPRQDLVNSIAAPAYMLDSINIYNSLNQCIKQFVLTHDYFLSSSAQNVSSLINSFTLNDISDTKRLKLTSVREYSGDGLSSKPPYSITYEETLGLPRRMVYNIDHWGYSNGSNNARFTPTVSHPICNFVNTGANRQPNWPHMVQFSIKTLRDPLGVLTTFEFENHKSSGVHTIVGGLRIKKITNTDHITGKSIVRKYNYQNGYLFRTPEYLYFPKNEYYFPRANEKYLSFIGYQPSMYIRCAVRQSQSVVPLQDFQGNHIGYGIVIETFGENGEGGRKEYRFRIDQSSSYGTRLDFSNYTAYSQINLPHIGNITGYWGNGLFNEIAPENLVYYQGWDANNYYPEAPQQTNFSLGQSLGEETFDSANNLIRKVENNYTIKYSDDLWTRNLKVFRTNFPADDDGLGRPGADDALTFYKLRIGYSFLSSTKSIDYKDGKAFTTFNFYNHESAYHVNRTSDSTINSTGDTIVTKTYYTPDFTNGVTADNVFEKMENRNMILPVATRVWKNGQLISGTITLYKDFATAAPDTFINPHKIYALETATPMSPAVVNEPVRMNGKFSTLIPHSNFREQAVFNVNGTTGKIIEQRLVTDKNQALIWDGATSLPLAQVDNASFADIAYCSFETQEKGNWSYSGTPSSDLTAPTGSKVYPASSGLTKTGLTSTKKYIISYWYKGGTPTVTGGSQSNSFTGRTMNGWTYRQLTVTNTGSISIGGTGSIDELRIHPEISQMTSYTYDSLLRLTAINSPNNSVSYYEYDSMNRVVAIKDQYGNVLKAFEYNYGVSSR